MSSTVQVNSVNNMPAPLSAQVPAQQDEEGDTFIAEFENMNLDILKDKQFLVAVSSGDRDGAKFVCSTIKGPYDFYDMVEQVGIMWRNEQIHAKVIICDKDPRKKQERLDEKTTDYIECHYAKIAVEGLLDGNFDSEPEAYTCEAQIVEDTGKDDPRKHKEDAATTE